MLSCRMLVGALASALQQLQPALQALGPLSALQSSAATPLAWRNCQAVREKHHKSRKKAQSQLNNKASWAAVRPFLQSQELGAGCASDATPITTVDTFIPDIPTHRQPAEYDKVGHVIGAYISPVQQAFAVVQLGCTQYKVTADDVIYHSRLKDVDISEVLVLNRVMMLGSNEETVIGKPYISGAGVVAVVEEQFKDGKVQVFKFKKRKGYRKLQGHRQQYTAIRILRVHGGAEGFEAGPPDAYSLPIEFSSSEPKLQSLAQVAA